jgi:hypothetical protein
MAHSGYQEQMVSWVDEGLVLLQVTLARLPAWGENYSCSPVAHERSELTYKAPSYGFQCGFE